MVGDKKAEIQKWDLRKMNSLKILKKIRQNNN